MASNAEKVLRLIVLLEPFYMLEKAAEEVSADDRKFAERLLSSMSKISKVIHEMKIIPAHEIQEEFIYYFTRKKRGLKFDPANDDDGEWLAEAA